MNVTIRQLDGKDGSDFRVIRLEMLKNYPHHFGGDYDDQSRLPESVFSKKLLENTVFGAFSEDSLIGTAGFFQESGIKQKHRGVLWGMYVKKDFRGKGIATRLVDAVIEHAESCVDQLHLTVETNNTDAVQLYLRHGFKPYGTLPRALKIGDTYYDEEMMVLIFTPSPSQG